MSFFSIKSFTQKATAIIAATLVILTIISCSDDPASPAPTNYSGENKVTYNVEYNENCIILSGTQKDALIKVDSTSFTFDKDMLTEDLSPGKCFIISGEYMRKVTGVMEIGNRVYVETEDAKLTDVVKNGTISWDFIPDFKIPATIEIGGKKIRGNKVQDDGYEFSYELDNWKYTLWFKPNGTAANGLPEILVNFTVENSAVAGGKITAMFGAKGTTRLPRNSASINIQNSTLSGFSSGNKGMRSQLTLEYQAVFSEGGGQAILSFPEITFKVPLQSLTAIPIPIPIDINFGLLFNTILNVPSVTAMASGKCQLTLDADNGFQFSGPTLDTKFTLNDDELKGMGWEVGDMSLSPAPVEVRHELSSPRVSVEIAGNEILWGALVFGTRSKLIIPSLCKAALDQVRIEGGYTMGMFGLTIAEDSKLFWEKSIEYRTKECE